jgi:hypothetical protein
MSDYPVRSAVITRRFSLGVPRDVAIVGPAGERPRARTAE